MPVLRPLVSSLCLILAVTASAQIVNCSSNDMRRHSCPANTSGGVRLERQNQRIAMHCRSDLGI
jgi:hypothetical protein